MPIGIVGLVSSVWGFFIGLIPPSQFGTGSPVVYFFMILTGVVVIGLVVPFLFLKIRKPSWKQAVPEPEAAPQD